MKKTVFISSTFRDLKECRRKVWETLEEYNVNIRGMEKFGARTQNSLKTSLAEVESSDIYLGIIAFRLGSIDKKSGKSITQIEYEKANELQKDILIYIMDEENSKSYIKDIDFDENHEKLKVFKSVLKENHTIDTFINEDDLIEKLKRRFNELLSKKEKITETQISEYDNSKSVIDKFILLPKLFSGKEIKIKIKLTEDPFPASSSVCEEFNLEFGSTLGYEVNIILPKINKNTFQFIFITEDLVEDILKINNKNEIEVYAKILFSKNSIDKYRENFIRKEVIHSPATSVSPLFDNIYGKNLFEPYTETIEGEGSIILLLTKILKKDY